jgi:hypothetical protein
MNFHCAIGHSLADCGKLLLIWIVRAAVRREIHLRRKNSNLVQLPALEKLFVWRKRRPETSMLLDHTPALLPAGIKRNVRCTTRSQQRKNSAMMEKVAHDTATAARLLLGSSCHIRRKARKLLTELMEIKRRRRSMRIEAA